MVWTQLQQIVHHQQEGQPLHLQLALVWGLYKLWKFPMGHLRIEGELSSFFEIIFLLFHCHIASTSLENRCRSHSINDFMPQFIVATYGFSATYLDCRVSYIVLERQATFFTSWLHRIFMFLYKYCFGMSFFIDPMPFSWHRQVCSYLFIFSFPRKYEYFNQKNFFLLLMFIIMLLMYSLHRKLVWLPSQYVSSLLI